MKKFIRLHDSGDNSPVIFKIDNIIYIKKEQGDSCTTIEFLDGTETYQYTVNETPEKIFSMIEKD